MPEVFLILFIVLAIVTLVGHGIWLLVAACFRALIGTSSPKRSPRPGYCFACGHPRSVIGETCQFCGAIARTDSSSGTDLQATRRQLIRWLDADRISREQFAELNAILESELPAAAQTEQDRSKSLPTGQETSTSHPGMAVRGERGVVFIADTVEAELDQRLARKTKTDPAGTEQPVEAHAEQVPPTKVDQRDRADSALPEIAPDEKTRSDIDQDPDQPVVTRRPGRTLADVLQAFLEDSNIRWVELICGVLIVGGAIGLVVTLRRAIVELSETIPYFPGLLLMLATAAIHAAGNYTLRRWNLRATSRGVLIIATLLIPLNFLAAIFLAGSGQQQLPVTSPIYWLAIALGLSAFGTMVYFAGRALMGNGWWQLTVAVMGTCIGQLVINRMVQSEMSWLAVTGLFAISLASFGVATIGQLWRAAHWKRISAVRSEQMLLVLGIATFSVSAPLALLLSKSTLWRSVLSDLAPSLSLIGAVVTGFGLLIHQRTRSTRLSKTRTTGTALSLLGGAIMLSMIGLAWPAPGLLISVGLLNGILLAALAHLCRLSHLHGIATACFAIALFVLFHVTFTGIDAVDPRIMLYGRSSIALGILSLMSLACGIVFIRANHTDDGLAYLIGSGVIGCLSVGVAVVVGFLDRPQTDVSVTTIVMFAYAVALLAAAPRISPGKFHLDRTFNWGGSLLLLIGFIHALNWNPIVDQITHDTWISPQRPIVIALLLHSTITIFISCWTIWYRDNTETDPATGVRDENTSWHRFGQTLSLSSFGTSLLAAPAVLLIHDHDYLVHSGYAAVLSCVWLAVALLKRWPQMFGAFQAMSMIAILFLSGGIAVRRDWWDGSFFDLAMILCQVSILALICAGWSGARKLTTRRSLFWHYAGAQRLPVDQIVLGLLVVVVAVVSASSCLAAIFNELGMAIALLDFPARPVAASWRSWVATTFVLLALIVSLWERPGKAASGGAIVTGAAALLLVSARFEAAHSVASAIRWCFALYGFILIGLVCGRRHVLQMIDRNLHIRPLSEIECASVIARTMALLISGMATVGLTTVAAIQVANGHQLGGPTPDSIFGRMGLSLSYGLPLLIFVVTLIACAVRERSSQYMLSASLVWQGTISLAFLLGRLLDGQLLDANSSVRLFQWNAIGLSIFSLAWLFVSRWTEVEARPAPTVGLSRRWTILDIQLIATIMVAVALPVVPTALITASPQQVPGWIHSFGSAISYLAVLAAAAACIWRWSRHPFRTMIHVSLSSGLALVGLSSTHWIDGTVGLAAFHHLLVGLLMVTTIATLLVCIANTATARQSDGIEDDSNRAGDAIASSDGFGSSEVRTVARRWTESLLAISMFFALRAFFVSSTVWWSVGSLVVLVGLTIAVGCVTRRHVFAYVSTVLASLAAAIAWNEVSPNVNWLTGAYSLFEVSLFSVLLMTAFWLAMEIRSQWVSGHAFDRHWRGPPLHQTVLLLVTGLMFFAAGAGYLVTSIANPDTATEPVDISNGWSVALVLLLGAILVATLWDRFASYALPCLYIWGLTGLAVMLDHFCDVSIPGSRGAVTVTLIAVAFHVALTGHIWKRGLNLARFGSRLGITGTVRGLEHVSIWLPKLNQLASALVCLIAVLAVVTFPQRELKFGAALTPVLLAYGMTMLAQEDRRRGMQHATLMLLALSIILLGWADLEPGWTESLILERAVRLLISLAVLAVAMVFVARRLTGSSDDWSSAITRTASRCGMAAVVVLACIMLMELMSFNSIQGVPFTHPYQPVVVGLVLMGLVAALLTLATSPERDPLSLSDSTRTSYVYAAEIVAAFLFGHIYLSRPMWFGGLFQQYWAYIVMAIAFLSAGLGEFFKRYQIPVLAEPLQRSSAFLPLIPALAFWVLGSEHRLSFEINGISYPIVMCVIGLLYATLCVTRQSLISGLAAAVACNVAILMFFFDYGLTFFLHPQFWFIPPALSVLIAAQINRDRLEPHLLTGIRYASVLVIYLSSTAEMVIASGQHSMWPPMVLAILAFLGALAGVAFRIRAFLYLGTIFVLFSVISMVWHAARAFDHVWPWWAFVFGSGVVVWTVFTFIQVKRRELDRLIEQLRSWDR